MGNRPPAYWIVVLVAVAAGIAAFMMKSSADVNMRHMAQYVAWGAIALLLIARFALRGKTTPTPPMPRD
jgi:heme A synthase